MASPERSQGDPEKTSTSGEVIVYIKTKGIKGRLTQHGILLKALRTQYGITSAEMGEKAGLKKSGYTKIENYEVYPQKDVTARLLSAATTVSAEYPDNPFTNALHESVSEKGIFPFGDPVTLDQIPHPARVVFVVQSGDFISPQRIAEKKKKEVLEKYWYNVIDQAPSYGDAMMLIREHQNINGVEFAQKLGIHRAQIGRAEKELFPPKLSTVNAYIKTSEFDYDGKAAQLLRLRTQNTEVMQLSEMKRVRTHIGKVVRYLRTVHGLTQPELGDILHYNQQAISNLENRGLQLKTMHPEMLVKRLEDWLKLGPTDPLREILVDKIYNPKKRLGTRVLSLAAEGKILFQNDLDLAA